jgi:hypothetical protein
MEQHNIEKLVKEAIKELSIEPSMQARERLIAGLHTEPKKKKRLWIYYASAAAVLILLFVVGIKVQNGNLDSEILPEITFQKEEVESNTNKAKQQDYIAPSDVVTDEVADQTMVTSSNKTLVNNGSKVEAKTRKTISRSAINDSLVSHKLLATKTNTSENEIKNSVGTSSNDLKTNSEKLHKSFAFITPEHLLASVETDSSPKMIPSKVSKTINYVGSNQLLLEMERQLFDEKNKGIFKKAGHQLKKVKTAVVNRNFKD